jgi:PAS domain S-box-containing protein
MSQDIPLTGVERHFDPDELIVSKTDLRGRLTYANRVFMRLADYDEQELLGTQHSIVRHPDMPRCIFKLLWDTIEGGGEIFAYVVNRSKNGDHYWVLAHVTPSFDTSGNIVGYHSNRRVPNPTVVRETIVPLYKSLSQIENKASDRKVGMQEAQNAVTSVLRERGVEYDEFVFSL